MIAKKLMIVIGGLALAGCNPNLRQDQLAATVGKQYTNVIKEYGAADRQASLPDGSIIYTYELKNAAGGVACTHYYTVSSGAVTEVRWRGSYC